MMRRLLPILFAVGAVCALLSAAVYIMKWPLATYTYLGGTFVAAAAQLCMIPHGEGGFVLRRLYRQQAFGALFLALSGVLMVFTRGNEWMVCLLVASVLELYTSFRISHEEKK